VPVGVAPGASGIKAGVERRALPRHVALRARDILVPSFEGVSGGLVARHREDRRPEALDGVAPRAVAAVGAGAELASVRIFRVAIQAPIVCDLSFVIAALMAPCACDARVPAFKRE
jgi:hypothetical protein